MGWLALRAIPEALHPAPVTDNDSAPVPEPPLVNTVIGVPAGPVVKVFVMTNGSCAIPVKVKVVGELDWLA